MASSSGLRAYLSAALELVGLARLDHDDPATAAAMRAFSGEGSRALFVLRNYATG